MEITTSKTKDILKTRNYPKTILPGLSESRIQQACIQWFRCQHADLRPLLFAVPNGGKRELKTFIKKGSEVKVPVEAIRMNKEGVTPGVSDLILLVSRKDCNTLCIEMKTEKGRQSQEQKTWQEYAESQGNKYIICRSLEQFILEVNNYLQR